MSELDRHLDVYDNDQYGYPRRVRIGENLSLPSRGKPKLKDGDLVTWDRNDSWFAQRFGHSPVGLVLDSRWMLVDWDDEGTTNNVKKWMYTPEAAILWCNGEFTNSSHAALKKISR
jgi:hypothetical protein